MDALTIRNARVLTLSGTLVRRGRSMGELGLIDRGFVRCRGRMIEQVGAGEPAESDGTMIDARGRVCMPTLVDAHAHLCWGGERWAEWEKIRQGVPYPRILAEGGGILSTVRATRAATVPELAEGVRGRLQAMARLGVGATEAKSGYGLDEASESRMLEAIALAATARKRTRCAKSSAASDPESSSPPGRPRNAASQAASSASKRPSQLTTPTAITVPGIA